MTTKVDRAAEPQMGDAAIAKGTGRDWHAWVTLLDAWGGRDLTHAEIARHVAEEHGIDGWWAQAVTVGYERIAGLRGANQRPDGFSMNASKTVSVPVAALFELFVDDEKRAAWLGEGMLRLRTSVPPKSARFDILDEEVDGILAATFVDKGTKSAVQLQINGLPDETTLAARKATWKSRLADLAKHVG
jgi:hypothetical protein